MGETKVSTEEQRNQMNGCGVLFKGGSGIIICGEHRVDGNCFLCKRCISEIPNKKNRKHYLKSKNIKGRYRKW